MKNYTIYFEIYGKKMKTQMNLSSESEAILAQIRATALKNDIKITQKQQSVELALKWLNEIMSYLDGESLQNILNIKK